jgi:hypothetical protein
MKTFTTKDAGIEDIGKVTMEQRINLCLEAQFWPWIRELKNINKLEKGQSITKYYIDTSIIEIFKDRLPNLTLKTLSEKTGFEYTQDRAGRAKLKCTKKQFVDFVNKGVDDDNDNSNDDGTNQTSLSS